MRSIYNTVCTTAIFQAETIKGFSGRNIQRFLRPKHSNGFSAWIMEDCISRLDDTFLSEGSVLAEPCPDFNYGIKYNPANIVQANTASVKYSA